MFSRQNTTDIYRHELSTKQASLDRIIKVNSTQIDFGTFIAQRSSPIEYMFTDNQIKPLVCGKNTEGDFPRLRKPSNKIFGKIYFVSKHKHTKETCQKDYTERLDQKDSYLLTKNIH